MVEKIPYHFYSAPARKVSINRAFVQSDIFESPGQTLRKPFQFSEEDLTQRTPLEVPDVYHNGFLLQKVRNEYF